MNKLLGVAEEIRHERYQGQTSQVEVREGKARGYTIYNPRNKTAGKVHWVPQGKFSGPNLIFVGTKALIHLTVSESYFHIGNEHPPKPDEP